MSKFYAVKKGRNTGVFRDWSSCQEQVLGFKGAEFKSFKTEAEAMTYLGTGVYTKEQPSVDIHTHCIDVELNEYTGIAYVDGSYKDGVGYSFGCVFITKDGEELYYGYDNNKEMESIRNVFGEMLGVLVATRVAFQKNIKKLIIAHDYNGLSEWAKGNWNAKTTITKEYVRFLERYRPYMDTEFIKVKSHSGNKYNTISDKLAKRGLEEKKRINSRKLLMEDIMIFNYQKVERITDSNLENYNCKVSGVLTCTRTEIKLFKELLEGYKEYFTEYKLRVEKMRVTENGLLFTDFEHKKLLMFLDFVKSSLHLDTIHKVPQSCNFEVALKRDKFVEKVLELNKET